MRLISWNVNGIRAVHKKGFLEWLEKDNADVVCLQETKAWEEQLPKDLLPPNGYNAYYAEAEKKGYSGTAVFSKKEPTSIEKALGVKKYDSEGRVIQADYGDFILYNIYFPNGKQSEERLAYKMGFYDAFLKEAEKQRKRGKEIIVCGDVNTAHTEIDLARPKNNENVSGFLPEERAFMDKWFSKGYYDTFRMFNKEPNHYTWWAAWGNARANNVGWRIDYFVVSEGIKDRVKDAFILTDVMGSDHCPIGIELE